VTFYQQRLVVAGGNGFEQRLSFSRLNSFELFTGGTGDAAAFNFTLASDRVNTILWMTPSRDTLLLGTQGGVWAVATPKSKAAARSSVCERVMNRTS